MKKTPMTKSQIPNNEKQAPDYQFQISNEMNLAYCLLFGIWCLELVCNLVLEV
jgi:hypothetical protein